MKRDMKKCVDIIVKLNEDIIDNIDNLNEPLLDELDFLKKQLSHRDQQVVQRLYHSIGYVEPKFIEIDEADCL